jgi:hypothetical protein
MGFFTKIKNDGTKFFNKVGHDAAKFGQKLSNGATQTLNGISKGANYLANNSIINDLTDGKAKGVLHNIGNIANTGLI